MKSLQTEFVNSNGHPIKIGGDLVRQMDLIAIEKGVIDIKFVGSRSLLQQGIALKSSKGSILFPNGTKTRLAYVWNFQNASNEVSYNVHCPDGVLKFWNIYKVVEDGNAETADAWTNNAGMIVDYRGDRMRIYRCSDGMGEFDPDNMIVQVSWS